MAFFMMGGGGRESRQPSTEAGAGIRGDEHGIGAGGQAPTNANGQW